MIAKRLSSSIVTVAVVAGGLLAASSPADARPTSELSSVSQVQETAQARAAFELRPALRKVLNRVNRARARNGVRPVRLGVCLSRRVAQPWARHMARTENMVHQDLDVIFQRCDGFNTAGENIAYGYASAAEVMRAWMNSSGHRANILNPSFRRLGLGVARSADGQRYWCQDFGG